MQYKIWAEIELIDDERDIYETCPVEPFILSSAETPEELEENLRALITDDDSQAEDTPKVIRWCKQRTQEIQAELK